MHVLGGGGGIKTSDDESNNRDGFVRCTACTFVCSISLGVRSSGGGAAAFQCDMRLGCCRRGGLLGAAGEGAMCDAQVGVELGERQGRRGAK